MELLIDTEEL